ncbi:RNA-binding protein [Methyloceanibacter sp.]|uniref:RNA-binding protein n=1 Tax=Methyloceanibacter sp. TaxID=1965321 RepID=UPI002D429C3C|nr:RNA-binding protein [Methyloceanibacter sp.]HZP08704.1 RNA-binding protein [Methyloceanibacter sp.]
MRHQAAEQKRDRDTTDGLRRCALTRVSRPKDELLRFVLAPDGTIVPDLKERLPGRGVWVTAAKDSVAEAEKRNVFARALKTEVRIPQGLAGMVERLLAEAALGALALANKAGEVVFGAAKVEEAIGKGKVLALVHASEAAEDGCRKLDGKFRGIKGETALSPVRTLSSHELGLASGRTNVIHAALIQGGAALRFHAAASRLERYRTSGAAFAARNGLDTDKE